MSAAQDRGSENVLDKHARNDGDVDQDDSVMLGYLALHERSVAPTLIGRLMPWFALSRHDFGAN
ncbi:MAG: hypothetical protein GC151_11345 [Betaproteobacteria bacterium]|nr:hypothetical protein [Betaproteobacteria bacterium]